MKYASKKAPPHPGESQRDLARWFRTRAPLIQQAKGVFRIDRRRQTATSQPLTEEEFIRSRSVDLGQTYCPACDPDLDPLTGVWVMCYCTRHAQGLHGSEDPFGYGPPVLGAQDMDAHTNRRFCAFIHRGVIEE